MKLKALTGLLISSRLKHITLAAFIAGLASSSHAAIMQVSSIGHVDMMAVNVGNQVVYAPNFTTGLNPLALQSIVLNTRLNLTPQQITDQFVPSAITSYLFESGSNGMPNLAAPVVMSFSYNTADLVANEIVQLRFSVAQPVQLKAETSYSFVVHVAQDGSTSGTSYTFGISSVANGYDTPDGGDWSLLAILPFSIDGGQSFSNGAGNNDWYPNIAVYAVPEPSTYALIGAALALGFVVIKRRKRS